MCICAVVRSVAVSLHLRQSFPNLEDQEKEKTRLTREMSALQRGVRSSTTYNPANNSTMSELDDDSEHEADNSADLKKKIEAVQFGTVEKKIGIREWRRFKRIFQEGIGDGVTRS